MRAAQTFVNIAQLTMRQALWNWGFPSHHTLPLQSSVASAWSGNDQLCLESAASTGVKRVHVNSLDVLQATFLYSIYHQRAGKTNLFHMRGGSISCFEYLMYL